MSIEKTTLDNLIRANVRENGNNEITGDILQEVLLAMSNATLKGYHFVGIGDTPPNNAPFVQLIIGDGQTHYGSLIPINALAIIQSSNEVGATPTVFMLLNENTPIATHNESTTAHSDIRETIEEVDSNLQQQIDAITSSTDVRDVVGTYAELLAYDTSVLFNDDIVKVLVDESKSNAISYYRWVITEEVGAWSYIGSQGPFYTKAESDVKYATKNELQTGLSSKADDTNVLHKTGAETATGVKTFSEGIKIGSVRISYADQVLTFEHD